MVLTLVLPIIFGFIVGLVYGNCFVEKFKKLYKKQDTEKRFIAKIAVTSIFTHIFLIISFLFLTFWLSANILVVLLSFMVAFWSYVLYFARF